MPPAIQAALKGVVLCQKADRHPLAGATNTNEGALIQAGTAESTRQIDLMHGLATSIAIRFKRLDRHS